MVHASKSARGFIGISRDILSYKALDASVSAFGVTMRNCTY
jgi:hypothetical protein